MSLFAVFDGRDIGLARLDESPLRNETLPKNEVRVGEAWRMRQNLACETLGSSYGLGIFEIKAGKQTQAVRNEALERARSPRSR